MAFHHCLKFVVIVGAMFHIFFFFIFLHLPVCSFQFVVLKLHSKYFIWYTVAVFMLGVVRTFPQCSLNIQNQKLIFLVYFFIRLCYFFYFHMVFVLLHSFILLVLVHPLLTTSPFHFFTLCFVQTEYVCEWDRKFLLSRFLVVSLLRILLFAKFIEPTQYSVHSSPKLAHDILLLIKNMKRWSFIMLQIII